MTCNDHKQCTQLHGGPLKRPGVARCTTILEAKFAALRAIQICSKGTRPILEKSNSQIALNLWIPRRLWKMIFSQKVVLAYVNLHIQDYLIRDPGRLYH